MQSTLGGSTTEINGQGSRTTFVVSSDAGVNNPPAGNLAGVQGTLTVVGSGGAGNRLIVSDAGNNTTADSNVLVTNGAITNFAPAAINYSTAAGGSFTDGATGDGVRLIGSATLANTFTFPSTQAGDTYTAVGGAANDAFNVGSSLAADNGDLDNVQGAVAVVGDGGQDSLEADDHGATGAFDYIVTPTGITNDPAGPARTFAGITYDSVTSLRLDGTDQVNIFSVSPSLTTTYFINGNLPVPGTPNGDYLKLNTTGVAGSQLHITAPGAGFWSFSDGHQQVQFQSIERFNHVAIVATGSPLGKAPWVTVTNADTGQLLGRFLAYPASFRGGVRTAVADINGDGLPDVITSPGPGMAPLVEVFNGSPDANGNYAFAELTAFKAFSGPVPGGAYVAAGDVNDDGFNDIVVGAGVGMAPEIAVFDGRTVLSTHTTLARFSAFGKLFFGGVPVAVGDLNNDGYADIVAGQGIYGTTTIHVYSGNGLGLVNSFTAFDPPFQTGGVTLAIGDINGDGVRDIVVGAGAGMPPRVVVFDGRSASSGSRPPVLQSYLAAPWYDFFGVIVQVKPINDNDPSAVEQDSIITSLGIL